MWNIPQIHSERWNTPQNTISPTKLVIDMNNVMLSIDYIYLHFTSNGKEVSYNHHKYTTHYTSETAS